MGENADTNERDDNTQRDAHARWEKWETMEHREQWTQVKREGHRKKKKRSGNHV